MFLLKKFLFSFIMSEYSGVLITNMRPKGEQNNSPTPGVTRQTINVLDFVGVFMSRKKEEKLN